MMATEIQQCVWLFLRLQDLGRMFDQSFPARFFLFVLFCCFLGCCFVVEMEISSCTLIPLFMPGSVHSYQHTKHPGSVASGSRLIVPWTVVLVVWSWDILFDCIRSVAGFGCVIRFYKLGSFFSLHCLGKLRAGLGFTDSVQAQSLPSVEWVSWCF